MRHERQAQVLRIGDLGRRHERRPDRQERVRPLGPEPLAVTDLALAEGGLDALPVPGADVVDDDIAGDVAERVRPGHPAGRGADHHPELHLEIEGVAALGTDDRHAVRDHRVGELGEEERPVRTGPASFGGVLTVVEPDAHDLARAREKGGVAHSMGPDQLGLGVALVAGLVPGLSAGAEHCFSGLVRSPHSCQ